MMKNYSFLFSLLLFSVGILITPQLLQAQELKVFSLADFDLTKNVKKCLVITDYGKEEFEFDTTGFLTKSVTRYNDTDYDVTYYKYAGETLKEKRLETYREGNLDKGTSIANIYAIDTTGNKIVTEKIVSYNNEFLDQYEYFFDADEKLVRIKRSNEAGIDETSIAYSYYRGETTKTYFMNEVIQKSIRDSKKRKGKSTYKIRLTKEYLKGEPNIANEQWYSTDDV